MKLITLSGLDGSGKSTQRTLLKEHLESTGKRVVVFHAVEFSLANRISRFLKGSETFEPGKEKAATDTSSLSLFLRKIFLCIDIFRFRSFIKKLQRNGVEYLLSDRYFYDTVVNIKYLGGTVSDRMINRIPIPNQAFYLRITPEEIIQRDRVPEQGLEYLQKKFKILERIKKDWHLTEIDASPTKDDIFQRIERIIYSD